MAIWLRFKAAILTLGAGLTALFGVYLYGRNRGSTDTKVKIERADHAKAKQIQDAADRARRADGGGVSSVDRLRKYRKLRDWSDDL
jgi:hypothetical protein